MSSRILAGARVAFYSKNNSFNQHAYAVMSIEGWQLDSHYFTNESKFIEFLKHDVNSSIAVIFEENTHSLEHLCMKLVSVGLPEKQLLIGCNVHSLANRLIAKSHNSSHFVVNTKITADGYSFVLDSLPPALILVWNSIFFRMLDEEVKMAIKSGSMSFLSLLLPSFSAILCKERTHIAHAIANNVSGSIFLRKRVICISIYFEVCNINNWKILSNEHDSIALITDLLEYRETYHGKIEELDSPWPASMPQELTIVETARLFQKLKELGRERFTERLYYYSQLLPLEIRAAIRTASSSTLKYAWSREHEAA